MQATHPRAATPRPTSISRTGAEIVVDALLKHGVDTVFGYIGASVLPLFDRLHDTGIRFVVPRHEQGGCHMADGYARASGRTGVVIATSGPGACNLVTGLATAMMDSVPLVAITGQVRTDLIGEDAFQEAPITWITRPITKHNTIVQDVKDLAATLYDAFRIASTGRPGPVLIDLPADIEFARHAWEGPARIDLPCCRTRTKPHAGQMAKAARAIHNAERPVLLAGGGVVNGNASQQLRELAQKAHLPVAMTLMGLGSYDQSRPESLDMLGTHGTAYANYAVQECDLLIAVGVRFDDRVTGSSATFAPKAQVVHIDIDPAHVSRSVRAEIPIIGDARTVLTSLIEQVEYRERAPWFEQIARWKTAWSRRYDRTGGAVKPQHVIEELHRLTDGNTLITTGVGRHQMSVAQFYRFSRARQLVTSGGLGTMGFGLPAAIGAQLACPEATVVDIDGDHSFNMTLAELATAVQWGLPIKVCILNNGREAAIRPGQEPACQGRCVPHAPRHPDYAAFARAVGAAGLTVNAAADVTPALEQMLATAGPCVVDFHTPAENKEKRDT